MEFCPGSTTQSQLRLISTHGASTSTKSRTTRHSTSCTQERWDHTPTSPTGGHVCAFQSSSTTLNAQVRHELQADLVFTRATVRLFILSHHQLSAVNVLVCQVDPQQSLLKQRMLATLQVQVIIMGKTATV